MKAKDIMTHNVISVTPVTNGEGRVVGIVSESDLFLKEKGIPFSSVKLPAVFKQWVDPARLVEIYAVARRHAGWHHRSRRCDPGAGKREVRCLKVN